jgi:hypothetical protein
MPGSFVFLPPSAATVGFYRATSVRSPGILCGRNHLPRLSGGTGTQAVVSGRRNRSKSSSRSRRWIANTSHNDQGNVFALGIGMNRARISFQKALSTKVVNHHVRHRSKVSRSIPNLSRSTSTRAGFIPCCIAAMSTTTTPQ